tara:strand:- start:311 stop:538 length:228 start_codon:yes stop_codon:yes gene_type:complete
MKIISLLVFLLLLSNCSLNEDSQFWTENTIKINAEKNEILRTLNKFDDITLMSLDEYKIYVEDYTKRSNYPDINK